MQNVHPKKSCFEQTPFFSLSGFKVKLEVNWLLLELIVIWTLTMLALFIGDPHTSSFTNLWMGFTSALGVLCSIAFLDISRNVTSLACPLFGSLQQTTHYYPFTRYSFIAIFSHPHALPTLRSLRLGYDARSFSPLLTGQIMIVWSNIVRWLLGFFIGLDLAYAGRRHC